MHQVENEGYKKIRDFTDLIVWQEAHNFALLVYSCTKDFPREETFGLTSQMRRASVSVASNIAEGFGRKNYKEKVQFYCLSLGSLYEVRSQILIAKDIKYLSVQSFDKLTEQSLKVQRLLNAFISKSKTLF